MPGGAHEHMKAWEPEEDHVRALLTRMGLSKWDGARGSFLCVYHGDVRELTHRLVCSPCAVPRR